MRLGHLVGILVILGADRQPAFGRDFCRALFARRMDANQLYIENPKKGVSTLEYYSITPDGHQEATHTEVLE